MRRYLSVLLALALTACGDDATTGPEAAIAGTYTLQMVNGESLPAVVAEGGQQRAEVTDGTLDVRANRTWSITLSEQVTNLIDNSVVVNALAATGGYALSGSSITFTAPGIGTVAGTVSGAQLVVAGELLGAPMTLVFER